MWGSGNAEPTGRELTEKLYGRMWKQVIGSVTLTFRDFRDPTPVPCLHVCPTGVVPRPGQRVLGGRRIISLLPPFSVPARRGTSTAGLLPALSLCIGDSERQETWTATCVGGWDRYHPMSTGCAT
jgi:hypothetical protein